MTVQSVIHRICNAYESGYGHGYTQDEMPSPYPEISDPELNEAYRIGYEAGMQMAQATAYSSTHIES